MLALWCVSLPEVLAQGTNASIVGKVVDENGEAIIGATVIVKNESTGFKTGTATSVTGEFSLKQLPLGSPYTITVSFIGYGDQVKKNYTLNQGDVLRIDFEMKEESTNISEVDVVANSMKKKIDVLGEATSISGKSLQTLPVNGRNFTTLVDLSPLSSGSNLAGQLYSSTTYTIDGMTAKSPTSSGTSNRGPFLVSMEAIREFEVVTNSYDVTQGRAGGGMISSVTKSGTNQFHGSAFFFHRADKLSSQYDTRGNKRSDKYSISQYGGSLGGPIIKNRMHFFVAWDHQDDKRPLLIADIHGTDDEKTYGITKENLDKFLAIAREKYGVAASPQTGSFDKKRKSNSVFGRLDWQLNATNLLTIRNNYNRDVNDLGINDNSKINLFEVYGTHVSSDNSLLASLRSVFGPKMTNEAKLQYLYTLDDGQPSKQVPSSNIPRAIVENITSTIDGKEYKLSSIQLGGQRYVPEKFVNNVIQFVDNLYYNTDKVNYTFGIDLMYTHLSSKATSEMNGRYYYKGLEAFENNTPYRYAREVPVTDPTVKQSVLNAALYGQAQFKPFRGVDVTLGLRGDYSYYFSNPDDNELLTAELGLKTTNKVAAFQLQPRFQLTWDIGERSVDIVRVGAGIFGSNMNNYAMVNNLEFDGLKVLSVDISSKDYVLPIPNFPGYREDPSSVPGVELFDQLGLDKAATFNVNGSNVKIPTVYKFNVSYNRFISERIRAGISFYGTFGRNNYMYVDRNMVDEPFFRLANEGNRGVYVPVASIDTLGNTQWTNGRKSEKIGRVLELNSDGKVNTYTIVADVSVRYCRDGQITASYTWNDSKDNTSYNGNVANSATLYNMIVDDPRDLSKMSYSDNQFRHKVVLYGNLPSFHGFNVGVRYSGIGGTRYSMVVNGNINGDFVKGNDLAFVFDPNDSSVPQAIRDGINGLLENPDVDKSFKKYLRKSFGKIAERNGGINGFSGTWDVRVSKIFNFYKQQRLELSVDIFNVANLIDKKSGLTHNLGKQELLNCTGFDTANQTFKYTVNNAAGKKSPGGNPWQIQMGVKYMF